MANSSPVVKAITKSYDLAGDRLGKSDTGRSFVNLLNILLITGWIGAIITGVATVVGSTGFQAGSLQFGPDGNLYGGGTGFANGGDLFRIDPATGLSTFVGATGFSSVTGLTLREPFQMATACLRVDPSRVRHLRVVIAGTDGVHADVVWGPLQRQYLR